jgi:zona occludens toxin (predicted ATPase)
MTWGSELAAIPSADASGARRFEMRTLCTVVSFVFFIAIAACANVETNPGSPESQKSDVEEVALDPATGSSPVEEAAAGFCGPSFCNRGTYCCNESCGICAPIGGFCTQQFCE